QLLENGSYLRRLPSLSSMAMYVSVTSLAAADFPATFSSVRITKMIGMSVIVTATACALACVARSLTIGFLDSGWKPTTIRGQQMSRLGPTRITDHLRKTTTESSYGKDGKAVVAKSEPFKLKLDVFANFAQFVYDDENPENPIGPDPTLPS